MSSLIKPLIESIQYNAALTLTRAIRGTSKEKLYQELGFESLQSRGQFRKLSLFYKIITSESPSSLYHLIPQPLTTYSTRTSEHLPPVKTNHSFFKNTFFPSTIIEWNKLEQANWNKLFRKRMLEFIRHQPSSIFNVPP